jgi:acyl carrier protein
MTATTDHESIVAEVAKVVRKAARIPARVPICAESRLVEDLAIDSLDLVSVILQIQDHFGVAIEEDAVPNLCRVADLASYVGEPRESGRS